MNNLIDYMWRVMIWDGVEQVTVALFLLESDARKWAEQEIKDGDAVYSVGKPTKSLTD